MTSTPSTTAQPSAKVRDGALAVLAALRRFAQLDHRQLVFVATRTVGEEDALSLVDELAGRKLVIARSLLAELPPAPPRPVYTLTSTGAKLLAQASGCTMREIPHDTPRARKKSAMFVAHTIFRNQFALALHAACERAKVALLFWEHDERKIGDAVHLMRFGIRKRVALVADGAFGIETPKGSRYFLVEMDRGTIAPKKMAEKFRGYEEWWKSRGHERRFGWPNVRILTVTTSAARLRRLLEAAKDVRCRHGSGLFWMTTAEAVNVELPERLLENVWVRAVAGDYEKHGLLD